MYYIYRFFFTVSSILFLFKFSKDSSLYDSVDILLVNSLGDLIVPSTSIIVYIFLAFTKIFSCLIVQLVIDSAHVDRLGQLCLLELAFVSVSISLHLLHQDGLDMFLHVFLSSDDVLGNFLVLFRSEMSFSRLLNVFFVNLLPQLVHLHLLM